MVTTTGKAEVDRYFADIPAKMMPVLRGAARAGGKVIAEEAEERCISSEVASSIRVTTKVEPQRAVAMIETRGKGAFIAPWLEYGTSEHFISVDDSQRNGMSVGRINRLNRDGKASLVIGGTFVGTTVRHPGAQPHPFLRPALDIKETEARAAAQKYINARVSRKGIKGGDEGDDQ
jgi:hypothetical protein